MGRNKRENKLMIKIYVKTINKIHKNVDIQFNNIKIDLGLLDDKERLQLSLDLLDGISDFYDDDSDVYDSIDELIDLLKDKYQ